MKKCVFIVALLCAALCVAATPAFADGLDFSSTGLLGGAVEYAGTGGAVTGSGIPITMVSSGASSDAVTGKTCGRANVPCGWLSFSTGNFITSGTNGSGQKFEEFAGGGNVTIIGEVPGDHHVITLLSGSFNGPVTFTLLNPTTMEMTANLNVSFVDPSVRALFPGATIGTGGNIVLTFPYTMFKNGGFNGHALNTNVFVSTPEPSSMLLLGSGFFGLAAMLRRKQFLKP